MNRPVPLGNRRIYVGNLPYATTESDLLTLFATAGSVRSVEVIRHRETGYPRGFGIVEMATHADALIAIGRFNACSFQGKTLAVNAASPNRNEIAAVGHGEGRASRS